MNYKLLGRSGLRVSELCLGTMTFGTEWGWGADFENSKKVFDAFYEAGGNFIDTANRYTEGTSEVFVGDLISADRDYWVLATKYSLYNKLGDINSAGNHKKNMVQSIEKSLKRLNTEYIDLFWLHAWDYQTPAEEVMRGLDDLISSGKVLYIGISDTPAWIVSQCNMMAELRGWTKFVALQIEYSLIQRTVERELIPMANSNNLAITPWGILGGGVLTGKYLTENDDPKRGQANASRLNDNNHNITKKLIEIANLIGASPVQVATKWLMNKGNNIIPIIGARKEEQILDSLGVLNIDLPIDKFNELEEISKIPMGFPHEFLSNPRVHELLFAGIKDKLIS